MAAMDPTGQKAQLAAEPDLVGPKQISVKTVGYYLGKCGAIAWPVRFQLDKPSVLGGYIIQEIKSTLIPTDCDGISPGSFNNDEERVPGFEAHYLEAWYVKPRRVTPDFYTRKEIAGLFEGIDMKLNVPNDSNFRNGNFNDLYFYVGPFAVSRMTGTWDIKGAVYFNEGGTLPRKGTGGKPGFRIGGDPDAILLESVSLKKDQSIFTYFDGHSLVGPTDHNLSMKWDCCTGGNKDTQELSREPK
jgi:hypothetical protein